MATKPSGTATSPSGTVTAYLTLYNIIQFLGWSYILALTARSKVDGGTSSDVWQVVQAPLKVFQTGAILEVLHSMFGFVRAPVVTTGAAAVMQVASRIWVLWGIVWLVPGETTGGALPALGPLSPTFTSLVTAWALSEIFRYGFFSAKAMGVDAYPLLWLRYSGFLALYPIGVSSELTMVWLALHAIRTQGLLSLTLPNAINFAFDYHLFCMLGMLVYLPGFPHMYFHMMRQRKRNLGIASKSAKKTQ